MIGIRSLLLPVAIGAVITGGVLVANAASSGPTVTIGIHWSHYTPGEVTIPAGVPVTFVLRNDDPIDHEWIVGDAALHQRHRTGTEPFHRERPTEQSIAPLSEVRTVVTFDKPGQYLYICHLPGHEAYGMVGVLNVTGT